MSNPNIGSDRPSPADLNWFQRLAWRVVGGWLDRYHAVRIDEKHWLITREVMQWLLIVGYLVGLLVGIVIGVLIGARLW